MYYTYFVRNVVLVRTSNWKHISLTSSGDSAIFDRQSYMGQGSASFLVLNFFKTAKTDISPLPIEVPQTMSTCLNGPKFHALKWPKSLNWHFLLKSMYNCTLCSKRGKGTETECTLPALWAPDAFNSHYPDQTRLLMRMRMPDLIFLIFTFNHFHFTEQSRPFASPFVTFVLSFSSFFVIFVIYSWL